ncbi:MAG TPA: F0F1 ATP synthase subunit A [Tepidisphaeraceae bacterium]|nr:F0F1 ATP synthase subunit A [Tepidisphaeraceae bacterium]
MQFILAASDPLEHVLPYRYFGIPTGLPIIHTFWFTNQIAMMLVASIAMLIIFPSLFNRVDTSAPRGWKNAFEFTLEFLRNEVFRPVLKDYTDPFLPFLWTLFFFILFCNILGLLPLAQIIGMLTGGRIQHMGGAPTGAITTTATLAFIAFIFIHVQGLYQLNRNLRSGNYGHHGAHDEQGHDGHGHDAHGHEDHGHGRKMSFGEALVKTVPLYLWNFAPHPFKDVSPLVDVPMWLVLLILELLGALIKPFALCMRLFGNMVSGHIVLAVLIGMIVAAPTILGQIGVGIPIMLLDLLVQLLEVLVAFLHAYIFTFLAAIFIASAVAPEH